MPDDAQEQFTRRDFVKGVAAFTATAVTHARIAMATGENARKQEGGAASPGGQIPQRPLGKTGARVSAIGERRSHWPFHQG